MKNNYLLFLASFIFLIVACKKDESTPQQPKNPVLGKWQLTESLYTNYKNGELEYKDESALNEFPEILQFNEDGTGSSDSDGDGGAVIKFRYSVADTAVILTDRKLYEDDKIIAETDEEDKISTKRLNGNKWFVNVEFTTEKIEGSVLVKNRQIYKNTWTKLK